MKKNLWSWTVIIISFMYGLLFWYSQTLTDGSEMDETPPLMSEERSANHVGSTSGMHAITGGART